MLYNLRSEPWRAGMLDAADLIEKHGHCKSELEDAAGRLCWVGAIRKALGYPNAFCPSIKDYQTAIDRSDAFVGDNVVVWNNAPERTAADVVAALRACAAS